MIDNQLCPLEANLRTGELFLRLKNHQNVILTPPRPSDTSHYLAIVNDPKVHQELIGPPVPFLPEHAQAFFAKAKATSDAALSDLEAVKETEIPTIVRNCPVNAIREVGNGEDVYLGDVSLRICTDVRLLAAVAENGAEDEETYRLAETNASRVVGDPEIIWTIGCYLTPSHHGKGIMTNAIKTLLLMWAVPRMRVRKIVVGVFGSNHGSVRVFQKNDFILTKTLNGYVEARGKLRDLHILEWNSGTGTLCTGPRC